VEKRPTFSVHDPDGNRSIFVKVKKEQGDKRTGPLLKSRSGPVGLLAVF
jgi:hypothetical protein